MNKIRLMLLNIYTIFSYDLSIISIYNEVRNKYNYSIKLDLKYIYFTFYVITKFF